MVAGLRRASLLVALAAIPSCNALIGLREGILDEDAGTYPSVSDGAPPSRYVTEVLADRPVAYWRLEETEGDVVHDETGRHHGRYVGNVVLRAKGALVDDGVGVLLDGRTARLEMDDVFRFPGNAPYSVEGWIKSLVPADETQSIPIFERGTPSAPHHGYGMYFGQTFTLFMRQIDLQEGFVQRGSALPRDEFVHFVATYDGESNRLYLNGELVGVGFDPRPLPDVAGVFVWGDFAEPLGAKLTGALDELAVYDYALGEVRARAHFEAAR